MSPSIVVSTVWLVWLVLWIIAARFTAKTVARQPISGRVAHSVLLGSGAFLLFVHPARLGLLTSPFVRAPGWIPWAGLILVALGLGWSVWARAHLGRLWSGTVTLKADHTIVRTGPYAITRHPIYTGLLLAFVGSTIVNGTILGAAGLVLLVLGLLVKIRQEEHLLIGHFGNAYGAYQHEVPALVPRL